MASGKVIVSEEAHVDKLSEYKNDKFVLYARHLIDETVTPALLDLVLSAPDVSPLVNRDLLRLAKQLNGIIKKHGKYSDDNIDLGKRIFTEGMLPNDSDKPLKTWKTWFINAVKKHLGDAH